MSYTKRPDPRCEVEDTDPIYDEPARCMLFDGHDGGCYFRLGSPGQSREEIAIEACRAVREACGPCGGTGNDREPDGSAVECQYCGRPQRAIWEHFGIGPKKEATESAELKTTAEDHDWDEFDMPGGYVE